MVNRFFEQMSGSDQLCDIETLLILLLIYLLISGLVSEADCQPCKGGFYCEKLGAINFDFTVNDTGTGLCAAGYYCKQGKIGW